MDVSQVNAFFFSLTKLTFVFFKTGWYGGQLSSRDISLKSMTTQKSNKARERRLGKHHDQRWILEILLQVLNVFYLNQSICTGSARPLVLNGRCLFKCLLTVPPSQWTLNTQIRPAVRAQRAGACLKNRSTVHIKLRSKQTVRVLTKLECYAQHVYKIIISPQG